MAYTPPTASDVKARYPEFDDVADSRVDAVITEASRHADDSWIEDDYAPALIHLAAHMLAAEGALDDGRSALRGSVQSKKLGDASTTWATRAGEAGLQGLDAELGSTVYGQRFLRLSRLNRPPVATTASV